MKQGVLLVFLLVMGCSGLFANAISLQTEIGRLWTSILQENLVMGEKEGIKLALFNYKHVKDNAKFDRMLTLYKGIKPLTFHSPAEKISAGLHG